MLAACGQDNAGGGGGFVMVPNCGQNGQVLSTDSTTGQLICKDLPAGTVSLPNCKPDTEAVTSDGKALFCTNRNNDTAEARSAIDQLNKVEMDITEYNTKINMIGGGGAAARPLYVGSVGNTKGRITSGNKVGLQAAAELCNATYTGARMCTVYDIYNSVATGVIKETDTINKAWVYMAAWNNPQSAAFNADEEGDAGMNENCAGYHYLTADQKWVGTAFAWDNVGYFGAANEKGLKFYSGGTAAACSQMYPIACCK
jgi:hypothetical protein